MGLKQDLVDDQATDGARDMRALLHTMAGVRRRADLVRRALGDQLGVLTRADPSSPVSDQHRAERLVVYLRLIGAAVTAVLIPFMPVADRLTLYGIVVFACAYSLAILRVLTPYKPGWLRDGYLPYALDATAMALAISVTGGVQSDFFVIYYPLAVLQCLRFGRSQAVFAPLVASASYIAGAVLAGDDVLAHAGGLAFRLFWVLDIAFLLTLIVDRGRTAESRLATELRRTRALLQAAHAPAASLTLKGVLGAVVQHSRLLTEADVAAVQLYSRDGEPNMYTEQLDDHEGSTAFAQVVRAHSRARHVLLRSHRPLTPDEVAAEAPSVPLALDEFASLCAVSIPGQRGKVGFVAVASRRNRLSPYHYEALAAFLERAALAIQNARLYEQLQSQMEELRSLHDQIVRAERLAAIGELAAKVAHELNNPLASIHLYNSLLLEQPAEPDEQYRLASSVQEQVERAKRVVRDILDYSRPAQAQLQVTNLNSAVEHGLRLVRHAANAAKVTVQEDYANNLPWVKVDVSRMAQVFTNLTLNAIQAMPHGGKLEISTGLENNELYVRFKDSGSGIAQDHLEHIFDPFFTTKPAGQGTGLGLAVCRSLLHQHHGDITVKSEPGRGATFTVWLPPAEVKEAMLAR